MQRCVYCQWGRCTKEYIRIRDLNGTPICNDFESAQMEHYFAKQVAKFIGVGGTKK